MIIFYEIFMGTENPFSSRTSPTLSKLDGEGGRKCWGRRGWLWIPYSVLEWTRGTNESCENRKPSCGPWVQTCCLGWRMPLCARLCAGHCMWSSESSMKLRGKSSYCSPFTDEETEVQRCTVPTLPPELHSQVSTNLPCVTMGFMHSPGFILASGSRGGALPISLWYSPTSA